MVTTRRRITTEQDRFGGYGIQPSLKPVADETETATPEQERYSFETVTEAPARVERSRGYTADSRTYTADKPAYEQPPVIEYSSRPYYTAPVYTSPKPAPTRAKKSRKRNSEDLMPSIKTRAYAGQTQTVEQEEKTEKAGLSVKFKAMLCVYLAVVLVLAVAVIATGVAVSNINGQASALEAEIAVRNEVRIEQNAEITRLTDPDRIAGAAMGLDMEKINSSVETQVLPTTDPVEYEGRTSGFDKFCDWLSKIIGG